MQRPDLRQHQYRLAALAITNRLDEASAVDLAGEDQGLWEALLRCAVSYPESPINTEPLNKLYEALRRYAKEHPAFNAEIERFFIRDAALQTGKLLLFYSFVGFTNNCGRHESCQE